MSERTGSTLGPHRKNNYMIVVKWILKRSKLVSLPSKELAKLKRFKAENKGQFIADDSFYKILSYAYSDIHELACLLMYETGIRPHEMLSLTTEHIEERTDDLVLVKIPDVNPETPSGRNKTGGGIILIRENAKKLLERQKKIKEANSNGSQARDKRIFPFKDGALSVAFTRMKQMQTKESTDPKCNFKGCLYDLRHSAITNLYLEGLTDQKVKKLVGRTPSSRMPEVYVYVHINHIIHSLYRNDSLPSRM